MRGWQILLIVLGVVILIPIVTCVGVIVWAVREYAPPQDIAVYVTLPDRITVGEPFTFTVRIYNDASDEQLLDSIDISNRVLDYFEIVSTEPAYRDRTPLSVIDELSFDYRRMPIPAGEEVLITFNAVPLIAGETYTYLDVCINTGSSCQTEWFGISVHEAAEVAGQ